VNKFKILYFSTVPSFFSVFLYKLINEVATKYSCILLISNYHKLGFSNDEFSTEAIKHIPFSRNPFSLANFSAYRATKKLLSEENSLLIHTQTPIASAIVRLANYKKHPLIYSAHGFHFHSKSNLVSWLIYFPIEFLLSYRTNVLVTINREDYNLARKYFNSKRLELIHGAGADFSRFFNIEKSRDILNNLSISKSSKIILSVGELNKNKNHSVVIKLLAERPELHEVNYVICGEGNYRKKLVNQISKLGLTKRVHLLGHRQDIPLILAASDLFVFPSKREGFGMALLEAILSDLDFVAFRIRGIVDLVPVKIHSSHLVNPYNKRLMGDMIVNKITQPQPFNHKDHLNWLKQFSLHEVNQKYMKLYESLLVRKDPSHL
jgi:glycosyltransferase involved in cell wall biosynthesis